MAMKSNFALMREKISAFMNHVEQYGLNELEITDRGETYKVSSDIVLLDDRKINYD